MSAPLTLVTSRRKSAAMAALAAPLAFGALYLTPLLLRGSPSALAILLFMPPAIMCIIACAYQIARCFKPCKIHLEVDKIRCEFLLSEKQWTWTEVNNVRLDHFAHGLRKPVLELSSRGRFGPKLVILPWGWSGMSGAGVKNAIEERLQKSRAERQPV